MAKATPSDLTLFLNDLLSGERKGKLALVPSGNTYVMLFTEKQAAFQRLPALTRARPLADELDEADDVHDGYGAAIWHITYGYSRLPDEDAGVYEEAEGIMKTFIPSLSELKASYADEASRAKERLEKLPEHKSTLQKFPIRDGRTLYDLTMRFLQAGAKLDTLLSERAKRNAEQLDSASASPKTAGELVNETVRLIRDCRASIANDLKAQPTLPRNLDALIFGYYDELLAFRAEALAKSKAAKKTQPEEK